MKNRQIIKLAVRIKTIQQNENLPDLEGTEREGERECMERRTTPNAM